VDPVGVEPVEPAEGGEVVLFGVATSALMIGSSDQLGLIKAVGCFGQGIVTSARALS
jgi:hypothetical protein